MGMYKFTDGESDMFKGDLPVFASDNEVSMCSSIPDDPNVFDCFKHLI